MPGWPAMPPAADPPPGARLALVVATSTYTDQGLRRLRAPARDAADLAQVLADPGIGGFAVTTVIDQPAQQIKLAVEDFLDGRGTQDLLLVYLSCHGLLDNYRRLYFAATDTRKDRLGSTGVESAWVLEQLEHCRARRQVLILDSCFSGAFAHGAKGEAALGLQDRFLGQGRGRVVLTASTATEYSFEGEPTDAAITPAGSVFTTALVQGLRSGAADTDHDGHVSVDDAYAYVFDQVQAAGAAQTPQRWLYGAEGRILLARNPAGPVITPAPLPESLRVGLDSPHPGIRIGAVTELGEWFISGDPARAATARRHLQEVADTDILRVAQTARTLLYAGTTAGPSASAVPHATAPAPVPQPPPVPAAPSHLARTASVSSLGVRARCDSAAGTGGGWGGGAGAEADGPAVVRVPEGAGVFGDAEDIGVGDLLEVPPRSGRRGDVAEFGHCADARVGTVEADPQRSAAVGGDDRSGRAGEDPSFSSVQPALRGLRRAGGLHLVEDVGVVVDRTCPSWSVSAAPLRRPCTRAVVTRSGRGDGRVGGFAFEGVLGGGGGGQRPRPRPAEEAVLQAEGGFLALGAVGEHRR